MPKIGKRILKSALAVFCCFLISYFRQPEGIVFYSCIAAVLCIQQDVTNTKKVGFNRIKGTLLGGFIGMLVLLFIKQFQISQYVFLEYAIISTMIIVIIYITVLLKMQGSSYISCVVFLSITVSHALDVNPSLFALNRVIDTLVGILVAVCLNGFHLPHRHHNTTLFVTSLSNALFHDGDKPTAYSIIKLKQLLEQGANITITTKDTPGECLPKLQAIPFRLPLIVMNGAVLYDVNKQEYYHGIYMDKELVVMVLEFLHQLDLHVFTHTIHHHFLHVYYDGLYHPVEEEYYHQLRTSKYQNYICHPFPKHCALEFMVMDKKDKLINAVHILEKQPFYHQLYVLYIDSTTYSEYGTLYIYHKDVNKNNAVQHLYKEHQFTQLYAFAGSEEDSRLLEQVDKGFAYEDVRIPKNIAVERLNNHDKDGVVHRIDKVYHALKK